MNRNFDNENRPRKNAYADFDEYGNPLTGNTNSLSRYTPQSRFGSFSRNTGGQESERNRQSYSRPYGERLTNATRAYGDMSNGTRYGEGGSNERGGSAYGHSYYGMSGSRGPGFSRDEGYWPESKRYGVRDYDSFISQNYGYFGRTSGGGYTNDDNRRGQRPDSYQNRRYEEGFGDTGRENRGYDRGFSDFGNTGYGATGYNMRDQDRERDAYSNRNFRNGGLGYNEEDERQHNDRNQNHYRRDRER